MEVEPDNVQIKTLISQPEVEQLKDCNKLSVREERSTEVCLDKLMEVMSMGFPLIKRNPTVIPRHSLPPYPTQSTESKVLVQVYWWLYDQTLKTGHVVDLTIRVYVISVYKTLLDRCYNKIARYEDFLTIREPSKYYAIIPDTQMLVYMESLYATIGETLTDRSLNTEENIFVLGSNMSWSLRLTFKELLEENTRIPYVTRSMGLMMAFDLSNHLWILVVFYFRTWTCLIYDLLADVIADLTPQLEKICTLLLYALLMHNKDYVPQSQLHRKWII
ncbi:hypothetical protein IFM89_016597 [Coptis chinensis]|uniref:Uncharacterized protein n=1 Tax=Coptis chinensis TaxID=261450 RepID=A0A835ITR7_9MAGN|nr:hypothetical protein IFM89_016597 [Coptis chinensis]